MSLPQRPIATEHDSTVPVVTSEVSAPIPAPTTTELPEPRSWYEVAAQLLFARIGSNIPPAVEVPEDRERMLKMVRETPLGGLILFNGPLPASAHVLEELQSESRIPMLITADLERGAGQQLLGATVFPHAMAFNQMGEHAQINIDLAARIMAREARAAGVHMTFAPVADVNSNPHNPIISTRAYGDDPDTVTNHIRSFIQACREEYFATTAKHFPGHGDTQRDSHETLATVDRPRDLLDKIELAPFRAAIEAGVDAVMTAHVTYPALDSSGLPATASSAILIDLLRHEMQFEGAVVSDSLLMGGIHGVGTTPEEQAVLLIAAGVDMLLDVAEPERVARGIERAVKDGSLKASRLEQAHARVRAIKAKTILRKRFEATTVSPTYSALAQAMARDAITMQARGGALLPIPRHVPDEAIAFVLIKPSVWHQDPLVSPLQAALQQRRGGSTFIELNPTSSPADYAQAMERVQGCDYIVACPIVKPSAWHKFGLLDDQTTWLEALRDHPGLILASLGTPVISAAFGDTITSCCTFSDIPASQRALVDFVLGH